MQIQPIENVKNCNFGTVYASSRTLSKRQEKIAKFLVREFREVKTFLRNDTLENYYKNEGYDFIIRPYGNELVSLDAYKGLSIEKSLNGKRATFLPKNEQHIGRYDEFGTAYLADDLICSFQKFA